jgi:hypothetical protein
MDCKEGPQEIPAPRQVSSVAEFVQALSEHPLRRPLAHNKHAASWYRGQADIGWGLLPAVLRADYLKQRAFFTFHPPVGPPAPPPPIPETSITRYAVPKAAKEGIRTELQGLRVDWMSLFPDLDHIALQLKIEHGLT